jgi:spore germination protein GerM
MESGHPSPGQQRSARRNSAGERQSYLLLAFGILIAITLPYVLQPRAVTSEATPTPVMGNDPPSSGGR